MSKQDNSGPAFPRDHASDGHNGMTLRDYFAARALNGLMTCPDKWINEGAGNLTSPKEYAHAAYEIADAMLKARTE